MLVVICAVWLMQDVGDVVVVVSVCCSVFGVGLWILFVGFVCFIVYALWLADLLSLVGCSDA